jgi:hypothetical protein
MRELSAPTTEIVYETPLLLDFTIRKIRWWFQKSDRGWACYDMGDTLHPGVHSTIH